MFALSLDQFSVYRQRNDDSKKNHLSVFSELLSKQNVLGVFP